MSEKPQKINPQNPLTRFEPSQSHHASTVVFLEHRRAVQIEGAIELLEVQAD